MSTGFESKRRTPLVTQFVALLLVLLALPACQLHYRPVKTDTTPQDSIVKRQLDADGSYYVRKGDTLYAIAFSYGLDAMEVAKLNGISSPYTIYPGQKLKLMPPAGGQGSAGVSPGVEIKTVKTPASSTTRTVETKPVETKKVPEEAKTAPPATAATPGTAPPAAAESVDPGAWKWPTEGRVIRGFVAGDPSRNGLDIAGKEGQPITASAAGQVVYSGNGLIGYGELIIVKHSENMLSAYAHNRVRLVKEGDQVWAGQKIAEMGKNSSDKPLLHFEIRQLGKPVNPMNYLPGR
jgi:lipoprotein NlpD